jgi:two-component system OmpR family response regulator
VRAILRRTRPERDDEPLRFADLVMDEDTHEVRRGDKLVALTPTEFKLLRYFLLNPRRVLSKTQLLEHVWEYDFGGDPNILETYISYLRKKLNAAGPSLIQTVRGVGYSLRLAE